MSNAKTLDGIVLKGGFLLLNTLENSRVTQDIDFSIDKEIGWTNLVAAVEASVASIGSDVCEIESICDPQEEMSGKIEIRLKENQALVGVDASWEPINVGVRNTNILDITIDTYTLCHILADKYCVVFSPKRFRRTKDLYDIYNILSNFDIEYTEFDDVVTHNRNQINWSKPPTGDIISAQYEHAWNRLSVKVLDEYSSATKIKIPEFEGVYGVVCEFIMEYKHLKDKERTLGTWIHHKKRSA